MKFSRERDLHCGFIFIFQMTYSKVIIGAITKPSCIGGIVAPLIGAYIGKCFDDAETQRMTRFRDRSALYGRPPPAPGVKEIPSW